MISPNNKFAKSNPSNKLMEAKADAVPVLEEGAFKLNNYALPPLVAGTYTLETSLLLKGIDNGKNISFENNGLKFHVTAPQFSLGEDLVNSVYPPARSQGAYHQSLPHIVFNRKTLPWERVISEADSPKAAGARPTKTPIPWFALLLLTNAEIDAPDGGIHIKEMRLADVLLAADNLLAPEITLDPNAVRPENVTVVELPHDKFKRWLPSAEVLPLLTHTRQVDASDKANADQNPMGWFSVMIAHRLPKQGADHTVCLVTLEGHDRAYRLLPPDANRQVRLVVLHKWGFKSQGSTFKEVLDRLAANVQPYALDQQFFPDRLVVGTPMAKPIRYGYLPVNHTALEGTAPPTWYSGPLGPVAKPNPIRFQYKNADELLRWDNPTAMYDISYAAAWQLGRLLALNHATFYTALQTLEGSRKTNEWLQKAKERILDSPSAKQLFLDEDDLLKMVQAAETDEVLRAYLMELWLNSSKA